MTWLSRSLWLLAWSFWAWLGWGLYRELPRSLGPSIVQLPIGESSKMLGFVGNSNLIAVQPPTGDPALFPRLHLYDAQTGRKMGERPIPLGAGTQLDAQSYEFHRFREALRYGVLLGAKPGDGSQQRYFAFDVVNAHWIPLSDRPVATATLHPLKPWVALVEGTPPGPMVRLSVVDLRNGEALFRRDLPCDYGAAVEPFFRLDSDALVMPRAVHPRGRDSWTVILDVFAVGVPSAVLEQVPIATHPFALNSVARSRISFSGSRERVGTATAWFDVYDFSARRFFNSLPNERRAEDSEGTVRQADTALSPSGSAVLRFGPEWIMEGSQVVMGIERGLLLNIDDAHLLWHAGTVETATDAWKEMFLVIERWQELWKDWLPSVVFETRAYRSLETGRLIARLDADADIDPRRYNLANTLIAFADGSVHRLNLLVNYPLLALCQTILALPLLLTWLALRWRRKRRLRLASVTP